MDLLDDAPIMLLETFCTDEKFARGCSGRRRQHLQISRVHLAGHQSGSHTRQIFALQRATAFIFGRCDKFGEPGAHGRRLTIISGIQHIPASGNDRIRSCIDGSRRFRC